MFKPEFEDTEYDRGKYMLKILGLTVSVVTSVAGAEARPARGVGEGAMHSHTFG